MKPWILIALIVVVMALIFQITLGTGFVSLISGAVGGIAVTAFLSWRDRR